MKKHSISNPTKSLIFCKSSLFFQNKARTPDTVVYSYKYICVYIVSFYADITELDTHSYHCRFTQSKPDKESYVAV